MRFQAPKGTQDITAPQIAMWQWVESTYLQIASRYGFSEIRVPTFEATELFSRGVGDGTDIVQKEMYTFLDKGARSITLRPEGTAGVIRAYLEHGMASLPSPVKLCYNITSFRYEKMQKGRLREFHQLGAEVVGSASPMADAELIAMLFAFYRAVGIEDLSLRLNSIGCPTCRKRYLEILQAYFAPELDEMCETCQGRYLKNTLRILDCKESSCQKKVADAPRMLDHLCDECQTHWHDLLELLEAASINYTIDTGIVRGLDYYTRTVFEFVSTNVGTQGTICGGGRYDGLVAELGGSETPAVGFAMGVERLLMELEARGKTFTPIPKAQVAVLYFPTTKVAALQLAENLRRHGVEVVVDVLERSFKAQLKNASKQNVSHVIALGEDEVNTGKAILKSFAQGEKIEQTIDLTNYEKIKELLA